MLASERTLRILCIKRERRLNFISPVCNLADVVYVPGHRQICVAWADYTRRRGYEQDEAEAGVGGNREGCPYGMTRGGGLGVRCGEHLEQAGFIVWGAPPATKAQVNVRFVRQRPAVAVGYLGLVVRLGGAQIIVLII